jgi:hypothetical protein
MAQETRAQLYAKILANLPDNTTEAITPATDRAVENAEVESCYNLLDDTAVNVTYNPTTGTDWVDPDPTEVGGALDDLAGRVTTIEGQGFQTAVQTPYTPASVGGDWLPEGDPTEVKGGLDILAARTYRNPSLNIAYVSTNGDDLTGERGNPLKPYATIQAAADAVPVNDSKVIVLGGVYSGGLSTTKTNFTLDITSCEINAAILIDGTDNTVIAYGAKVTSSSDGAIVSVNSTNLTVEGGEFIGVGVPAYKVYTTAANTVIKSARLTSNTVAVDPRELQMLNCNITTTSATREAIKTVQGEVFLSNCKVSGGKNGVIVNPVTKLIIDNNCEIEGTESAIKTSSALTAGEQNMDLKNSTLTGGSFGIGLFREVQDINIKNCIIDAPDAFLFIDTLRVGNAVNFIQGCKLLCTQVVNVSSYNASDVGTINFVNCSTTTAIVTGAKVIEFNTYLNANL